MFRLDVIVERPRAIALTRHWPHLIRLRYRKKMSGSFFCRARWAHRPHATFHS